MKNNIYEFTSFDGKTTLRVIASFLGDAIYVANTYSPGKFRTTQGNQTEYDDSFDIVIDRINYEEFPYVLTEKMFKLYEELCFSKFNYFATSKNKIEDLISSTKLSK